MNEYEYEIFEVLENLLTLQNTADENGCLETLVNLLHFTDLYDNGSDFLQQEVKNNQPQHVTIETLLNLAKKAGLHWQIGEEMDWFIYYLFHRRFGWSDLKEDKGCLLVTRPECQGRFRRSSKQIELKFKSQIVANLDSIITWLFHQPPQPLTIRMYSSAARVATEAPVTRMQIIIHAFNWLKERLLQLDDRLFESAKDLFSMACCDVWSQIRSAAVSRLGPIVERLNMIQLQQLFEEFFKLCEHSTWQTIDGSISAINSMIKRFQRVGYNLGKDSLSCQGVSPRVQSQIKFGSHTMEKLPSYISQKMKYLVFQLLSNKQLTVRETAVKAFVNCLNKSSEHESELAFHEVYQRLNAGISLNNTDVKENDGENDKKYTFMDPYTAESLLQLCVCLFKRIRDHRSYLENWEIYHATFDVFLMHPASSVRLAASNLYKYIVALSVHNPVLVKNILNCLIRKWHPDQSILLRPVENLMFSNFNSHNSVSSSSGYSSVNGNDTERVSINGLSQTSADESSTWEWREGRLMVYELVCQLLIKNHHVYTFGPASLDACNFSNDSSCGQVITHNSTTSDSAQSISRLNRSHNLSSSDSALHLPNVAEFPSGLDKDRLSRRRSQTGDSDKFTKQRMATLDVGKMNAALHCNNSERIAKLNCTISGSFVVEVRHIEQEQNAELVKNATSFNSLKDLPSFRTLLCKMLHTCVESLVDHRWEVRRMARQCFDPLSELLRWFDPQLLADLVSTHLAWRPSLMTFACLQLLKGTLQHAAKLLLLVNNPPADWQGQSAMLSANSVIQAVHSNLADWLRSCRHYLLTNYYDCILPVTSHCILLALLHFPHHVSACGAQNSSEVQSELTRCFVDVFRSLDKQLNATKDVVSAKPVFMGFEIYPSMTQIALLGCSAAEYCMHLIAQLRDHFVLLFQSKNIASGEILPLLPLLLGWITPISQIRGDYVDSLKVLLHWINLLATHLITKLRHSEKDKCDHETKIIYSSIVQSSLDKAAIIVCSEEFNGNIASPLDSCWWRQFSDILLQLITAHPNTNLVLLIEALTQSMMRNQQQQQLQWRRQQQASCPLHLYSSESRKHVHENDCGSLDDSLSDADGIEYFAESLTLSCNTTSAAFSNKLRTCSFTSSSPPVQSISCATTDAETDESDWDSSDNSDEDKKLIDGGGIARTFLSQISTVAEEQFYKVVSQMSENQRILLSELVRVSGT